jgi:D-amino peptidase
MKIQIAVDMEGCSGIVNWDQVHPGHEEYARFRHILTGDVNAAIEGAFKAGATDVLVSDGHADATNVLVEELDKRARLNSGAPSPLSMVHGIDGGRDGLIFVGYHARVGSQNAIMDHTWSSVKIVNVWLNGRICGEIGLNASVAGHFGVPLLMISGDQTACAEAADWVKGVEIAIVKVASGRYAAECLPTEAAHQKIRETAENAVRKLKDSKAPQALKPGSPVKITVELFSSDMADRASLIPVVTRLDAHKVEFTVADMPTAYRTFRAVASIA